MDASTLYIVVYLTVVIAFAFINYRAALRVKQTTTYMKINPPLYAIGSLVFGGIYPLIFLIIKCAYCSNRNRRYK